jgi:hypothetical protein
MFSVSMSQSRRLLILARVVALLPQPVRRPLRLRLQVEVVACLVVRLRVSLLAV